MNELDKLVEEMRRFTDATNEHGSIDAAVVREWTQRIEATLKQSAAGERVDLEQFRPAVKMWGNTARLKLKAVGLSLPEHYRPIIQAEVLDANRLLALLDSQKSGEGERRSNHHVHRGPESLPCYCDASADHQIGEEVVINGETLARRFHEVYERLAPSFGYETRTETRQFDPSTPNGRLMIAVCTELSSELPTPGSAAHDGGRQRFTHCQNGLAATCLASQHDGVICADDECDIDSGVRSAPPIADASKPGQGEEVAGIVEKLSELRGTYVHLYDANKHTGSDGQRVMDDFKTASARLCFDFLPLITAALSSPRADVGETKDAARYRWLRIAADISWNDWHTHSMLVATDEERDALDAAIDNAMLATAPDESGKDGES